MKIFQSKLNKGFTIVETIIALLIFSIVITTMMSVMGQGIQNTTFAKNKIIATYLAQEGIEYFRNLRDNYVYFENGFEWSGFLDKLDNNGCTAPAGCYFDDSAVDFESTNNEMINSLDILPCNTLIVDDIFCPWLLFDNSPNKGKYGYHGTKSNFIRKIKAVNRGEAVEITSTVYFRRGNIFSSVSFSDYLFNITP